MPLRLFHPLAAAVGVWAILAGTAVLNPVPAGAAASARYSPVLGQLHVGYPTALTGTVMVLLSDATGFDESEQTLFADLVERGNLVIGVDRTAVRRADEAGEALACSALADGIETAALHVERRRHVTPYRTPVLIGAGIDTAEGAALMRQVRRHKIAGVVALRSDVTVPGSRQVCVDDHDRPGSVPFAQGLTELDHSEGDAIAAAAGELAAEGGPHGPGELADLPLTVMKPGKPARRLVVQLTGDGGAGPLDRGLARALVSRGFAVALLDSRRYFWSVRDPSAAAVDLARIVQYFRRTAAIRRVALVGYSFGADYLPLTWSHLPADIRSSVAVVSLLAPAPATDLRVELRDEDYANGTDLLPQAARIDAPHVQCLYGRDDRDATLACPVLGGLRPQTELHSADGGHDFDGDVERLADIIAAPLDQPLHPRSPRLRKAGH